MNKTLDPFYENLIEIWKSGGKDGGPGGWAGYYYGIFSQVIKDNNFKTCVEVGIGYGFHAKFNNKQSMANMLIRLADNNKWKKKMRQISNTCS